MSYRGFGQFPNLSFSMPARSTPQPPPAPALPANLAPNVRFVMEQAIRWSPGAPQQFVAQVVGAARNRLRTTPSGGHRLTDRARFGPTLTRAALQIATARDPRAVAAQLAVLSMNPSVSYAIRQEANVLAQAKEREQARRPAPKMLPQRDLTLVGKTPAPFSAPAPSSLPSPQFSPPQFSPPPQTDKPPPKDEGSLFETEPTMPMAPFPNEIVTPEADPGPNMLDPVEPYMPAEPGMPPILPPGPMLPTTPEQAVAQAQSKGPLGLPWFVWIAGAAGGAWFLFFRRKSVSPNRRRSRRNGRRRSSRRRSR